MIRTMKIRIRVNQSYVRANAVAARYQHPIVWNVKITDKYHLCVSVSSMRMRSTMVAAKSVRVRHSTTKSPNSASHASFPA
jgi:hypothetical protein